MKKMTYKEFVFKKCNNTDLSNTEQATELARFLAKEALLYNQASYMLEQVLKKYLTAEQFEIESERMAKELFKDEIDMCENEDLKQFMIDNFEEITRFE